MMHQDIIVIAETQSGQVLPVTYELLTLATQMDPDHIAILVMGTDIEHAASEIAAHTGMPVAALTTLAEYTSELWIEAFSGIVSDKRPRYIIVAHTACGQDFAPGLAVRLGGSCLTAVQGISITDDATTFTRAILNGKFHMDITPHTYPCVITIQPGTFGPITHTDRAPGMITRIRSHCMPRRITPLGILATEEEEHVPLHEAETIVSAGRGIGQKENLVLIERLASLFTRAAVGGSRPLCDSGWLAYRQQVGLTGKTVTPKLYIACGISGSPQHVAGMKNAQLIFAINKDPHAAIFQVADYGIVADLVEFIPVLLQEQAKI